MTQVTKEEWNLLLEARRAIEDPEPLPSLRMESALKSINALIEGGRLTPRVRFVAEEGSVRDTTMKKGPFLLQIYRGYGVEGVWRTRDHARQKQAEIVAELLNELDDKGQLDGLLPPGDTPDA